MKELTPPIDIPLPPIRLSPHNKGDPKYTQQLAQAILLDVATTTDSMMKIARKHGIWTQTIYYWIGANEVFKECYTRALKYRATVYGSEMLSDMAKLTDYVENEDNDPRMMQARIQLFHRTSGARQWLMTKWDRQTYGDKVEIDQHVTMEPAKQRENAWDAHKQAVEGEYTEES